MHHHRQQQPHGIYNDVSLSTVDLLASVIATRPPFSRRLNRLAVYDGRARCWVGCLRPSELCGRRASWTRSHVPSCLHSRKYHHTVPKAGGHAAWLATCTRCAETYTVPLTTSRSLQYVAFHQSWLMGVGKPEHPTVRRSGRWGMVCVSYLHSNTCPRLLTHPLRKNVGAEPALSLPKGRALLGALLSLPA